MRQRIITAGYVLGGIAVLVGVLLWAHSGQTGDDGRTQAEQGKRAQAGEGVLIDGPFINLFLPEREDASRPVDSSRPVPATTRSTLSAAGGGAAPAGRPAVLSAPPAPACSPSLLGSVIGLLGALLGGGGC